MESYQAVHHSADVASELRSAPRAAAYFHKTVREYLNDVVSRNSRRAAEMREHAAPTVVTSQVGDAK